MNKELPVLKLWPQRLEIIIPHSLLKKTNYPWFALLMSCLLNNQQLDCNLDIEMEFLNTFLQKLWRNIVPCFRFHVQFCILRLLCMYMCNRHE